jgi:hypothetical protein
MRPLVVLFWAVVALGGCAGPSDPSEVVDGEPAVAEAEGQGFVLTLRAEDPTVRQGQEIHVAATIASQDGDAVLTGSGSGIVFFSVTRLEDGLTSGPPGWRLDCREHVVPDEPMEIPFAKSGGIIGNEPHVGFLRSYFADPDLTLPAGTWRIDAMTHGSIGRDCAGNPLNLATSVEVSVTD